MVFFFTSLINGFTMIIKKSIFYRNTLTDIFIKMGVKEEIAAEDACKIEHDLSVETFDALCKYAKEHGLGEE